MPETVLITGAGGFIGGRIAEVIHCSGQMRVRAAVRRWSSAARIGRFDMEIVQSDVMNPVSIAEAMKGVDLVVNCAWGSGEVNRGGTRQVLEAAKQAGVKRVVHMSTVSVYGNRNGPVDESVAIAHSGNEYGDSKIDTEAICWEYAQLGLEVVVLRPTVVYGPFSENWTVEFVQRMASGQWMMPREYCEGIANLVYVDDVVGAVIRGLRSVTGANEAYNVNGPELDITWNRYFDALNAALDLPPLKPAGRATARMASTVMQPVRTGAKMLLRRFEAPILELYKKNALAKAAMKLAESAIRKTPTLAEYALYSRTDSYPTSKAERLLGYKPAFEIAGGVALSAAWARHHRYVLLAGV